MVPRPKTLKPTPCSFCGERFDPWDKHTRFCSPGCAHRGYKKPCNVATYKAVSTGNKTTMAVHRFLMQAVLGRKLHRNEVVHHVNHDTKDNRLENLRVMSRADHRREHAKRVVRQCVICHRMWDISTHNYRKHQKTCGRKCAARLTVFRRNLNIQPLHVVFS